MVTDDGELIAWEIPMKKMMIQQSKGEEDIVIQLRKVENSVALYQMLENSRRENKKNV